MSCDRARTQDHWIGIVSRSTQVVKSGITTISFCLKITILRTRKHLNGFFFQNVGLHTHVLISAVKEH